MLIRNETVNFLMFVLMGVGFSIIFDFFRAIRKVKKSKINVVYIQDIIYFIIIGMILVLSIINIRDETFRLYLIIAIILGIVIYMSLIGNIVRNIFVKLLKAGNGIIDFIFLPIKTQIMFFNMIGKKIKKYVKQCCKKKSYMIEFYHEKVKKWKQKVNFKQKTKEGRELKNDKF